MVFRVHHTNTNPKANKPMGMSDLAAFSPEILYTDIHLRF
jgi:hypothetical protein